MPRIPESAVQVRVSPLSTQPIREELQIGQAITGLTQASIELTSRLAEAERIDELTRKSTVMEGSLADLRLSIAQDPELNTVSSASQAYTEGSERIFSEMGESSSRVVSQKLEKQFTKSSLQGHIAVKQFAYKRQSDAAISDLDASADMLERIYAAESNSEKREDIRKLFAQGISLSPYLSEQEKGDRIRSFWTATDKGHVRGLINMGLLDEAEDMLFDPAQLIGLNELERQAMIKTLNTARDQIDSSVKQERAVLEEATAKSALLKIAKFEQGEGLEYTFTEFEEDSPNLSVQDFRTVRKAMLNQGIVVVEDRDVISDLNGQITDGLSSADGNIHSAFRSRDISQETFERMLSKNQSLNDGTPEAMAYEDAYKDINTMLGPTKDETRYDMIGDAVARVNRATDEMDHYRETHQQATPEQIDEAGKLIRDRYRNIPEALEARPVPYSLGTREKLDETQLRAAEVKLGEDYDNEIVDSWQRNRESENIQVYRADLERRSVEQ